MYKKWVHYVELFIHTGWQWKAKVTSMNKIDDDSIRRREEVETDN